MDVRKQLNLLLCVVVTLLAASCGKEKTMANRAPIPGDIHGWKATDEVQTYNRGTIFDYIDGAGEVYRQYDFRELTVHRFVKSDEPEIVLELFDMGSSKDAYGVFTHGREGEEAGIGQGSEQKGSFLCFWKSRYFVCAYAEGESQSTREAVTALGKYVAEAIDEIGPKPKILDSLPKEGLIEKNLRFFHTHASLNYHYFVASENILNLNDRTDAVLAAYDDDKGKTLLLLISYPNKTKAQAALDSFVASYMPEAQGAQTIQTENGTWVAAKVVGNVVAVVFEALDKEIANRLLQTVNALK